LDREVELAAERKEKVLAPHREKINKYVFRFGDQMISNPKWRGYLRMQDVAKRCIEEYVLAHGKLPTGEHYLFFDIQSGLKHDFSDL
jgi:hypothetical protein